MRIVPFFFKIVAYSAIHVVVIVELLVRPI